MFWRFYQILNPDDSPRTTDNDSPSLPTSPPPLFLPPYQAFQAAKVNKAKKAHGPLVSPHEDKDLCSNAGVPLRFFTTLEDVKAHIEVTRTPFLRTYEKDGKGGYSRGSRSELLEIRQTGSWVQVWCPHGLAGAGWYWVWICLPPFIAAVLLGAAPCHPIAFRAPVFVCIDHRLKLSHFFFENTGTLGDAECIEGMEDKGLRQAEEGVADDEGE